MAETKIMNIYEKLQKARVLLQKKELKKSGRNKFANYSYFELGDFLPTVNEIFFDLKLCSTFSINNKEDNADRAALTITNIENPEEVITFESPSAEANMKGSLAIQQLGAQHTYLRRYLYMNALEIVENDIVDATEPVKEDNEPKASKSQIETIEELVENIPALLTYYKIEDITDLTKKQASEVIVNKTKEVK